MATNSTNVVTFVNELGQLSGADATIDAIRRYLGQFGIESFAFVALPKAGENYDDVILAVHEPPELLRALRENHDIHASPALRQCRRTVQPFAWKDAPYDREREPRAAEFVELLTDFGFSNAVMVPVPGPGGCVGAVWLARFRDALTAPEMPIIHIMALYAFECLKCLERRVPKGKPCLTAREREVLTWVAQGKSAWEVGEILGIAKRTVDEHTQIVMRKLGAVNRTHAVVIAAREGLIDLN